MSDNHIKNASINLLLVFAAISLPLLVSELAFRLIRVISNKPPYYQSDSVLGWKPIPSIRIKGMPVVSSDGTRYRISFSTDRNGLRFSNSDWPVQPSGNPSGHRTLVLGDSFTGDAYTSDKDAWFAYLNRNLSLPVYAYGIGGSGTYQQYLALKKLLPVVKPDIIILQSCSNDIQNNDPSSIFASSIRNQELRRPYLSADGAPFYAQGLYASVYRFFFSSSQIFAFIDNQIAKKGISFPFSNEATVFQASTALNAYGGSPEGVTKRSLELFAEEARTFNPEIILYGILCDSSNVSWWKQVFESLDIIYIKEPLLALEREEDKGRSVRVNDFAHWNILGNEIFGKELARQLSLTLK